MPTMSSQSPPHLRLATEAKDDVLITGASRGLGRHLAHEFARHGHRVAITARSQAALETLASELRQQHGAKVLVIAADLADRQACASIIEACREHGLAIRVVLNNAGMMPAGGMCSHRNEEIHRTINLNVRAAIDLSLAFVDDMRPARRGTIINISSLSSTHPIPGASLYGASKAFLSAFSRSLDRELDGTGLRCLDVRLGPMRTSMLASAATETHRWFAWLHRFASRPESVAEVIYDGYLTQRSRFSAGMLGALLHFGANLIRRPLRLPKLRKAATIG